MTSRGRAPLRLGDVRSTAGSAPDGREDLGLRREQPGQALVGEVEHLGRGCPVEGLALGRALELDVRARVRADDVEVDLGPGVLAVVEVEVGRAR